MSYTSIWPWLTKRYRLSSDMLEYPLFSSNLFKWSFLVTINSTNQLLQSCESCEEDEKCFPKLSSHRCRRFLLHIAQSSLATSTKWRYSNNNGNNQSVHKMYIQSMENFRVKDLQYTIPCSYEIPFCRKISTIFDLLLLIQVIKATFHFSSSQRLKLNFLFTKGQLISSAWHVPQSLLINPKNCKSNYCYCYISLYNVRTAFISF